MLKSWLNAGTMQISESEPIGIQFGDEHVNSAGNAINSYRTLEKKETITSNIDSERCTSIGSYPANSIFSWEGPTKEQALEVFYVLRRFLMAYKNEREKILIDILGFEKTGFVLEKNGLEDYLYVYRYFSEPTNMEVYMTSDPKGTIMELNRYNNSKGELARVSLDIYGLIYIFMQIYGDMNKINFAKLDMGDILFEVKELLDFDKVIPNIDNSPLESLPSFWNGYIY